MTEDNGYLRDQINRYHESKRLLDEVQRRDSSDATTGLFNRNVGEGYLRLRLSDDTTVTVFTLDLSAAKHCDEATLQRASQALVEFNGTFEMICRWGPRRFLLITAAEVRPGDILAQIKRRLKAADVAEVRFVIARSQPGDKVGDIIARLDDQLSRSSNQARLPKSK
jgi:GGDEF domain-containing protein